jgi:hypothetical protein
MATIYSQVDVRMSAEFGWESPVPCKFRHGCDIRKTPMKILKLLSPFRVSRFGKTHLHYNIDRSRALPFAFFGEIGDE